MAPRASLVIVAACLGIASAAHADEPINVLAQPRLPAPLVLPELMHPRSDVGFTYTVGAGSSDAENARPTSAIALVRTQIEGTLLAKRQLYAGITWDYASALPPDKGADLDDASPSPGNTGRTGGFTNVEPHIRSVFPLTAGLAFGFGLGATFPTSVIERNGPARSALLASASLDPTDYVRFQPGRFAVRPWGDLRIVRGLFVFQARQGIDVMIDQAGLERARTAGRILAHVGVTVTRALELSLEATQVYFFFTEEPSPDVDPTLPADQRAIAERRAAARERYRISDDRRTAFTFGPSVRLSFPNVDLGLGLVTNLFAPLSPALDSFVAARMSLVAHFR